MTDILEYGSTTPMPRWFSYKGGEYNGPVPAFIEDAEWSFIEEGEKRYPQLRAEIEQYLQTRGASLQPYFNTSLVKGEGAWKVAPFYTWGVRNEETCRACPQVDAFLKSIPGLVGAAISVLPPHTEISEHIGDTNTVVRCHLGLSIPPGFPDIGFEVKGEKREWKQGKWLLFLDAFRHRAWNRTDQPRYLLIIDVVLPRFLEYEKDICKNVRSLLRLQALLEKRQWMKKLPGPVLGLIRHYFKFTL